MELDVLAFASHRDDIELTCAGTMIKLVDQGYKTGIIDLTAGEMGTRGSAEERAKEAEESAKILQIQHRENLGIPDANIEINMENKLKIVKAMRKYRPRIIFLPYWEDRHPDHARTGKLVSEAAFIAGLSKLDTGQPKHRPEKLIYYMCQYEFEPSFIVDVTEQHERKMAAARCFKSQIYNPDYPGEQTMISSPEYMESIEVRSRYYGWRIKKTYGEPFLVREALEVEDIMAL
ncbi:bacillithiol biosynthesis deacetylase BshB1 [Candidatus Poribacteria bacterium]